MCQRYAYIAQSYTSSLNMDFQIYPLACLNPPLIKFSRFYPPPTMWTPQFIRNFRLPHPNDRGKGFWGPIYRAVGGEFLPHYRGFLGKYYFRYPRQSYWQFPFSDPLFIFLFPSLCCARYLLKYTLAEILHRNRHP